MSGSVETLWPLVLLPLLPLVVRWGHRAPLPPKLRRASTTLRCVVVASLTVALCAPQWHGAEARIAVAVLVDGSASVHPAARAEVLEGIANAAAEQGDAIHRFFGFGEEVSRHAGIEALTTHIARADASRSRMGMALEQVIHSFGSGESKRVLLVTDGRATDERLGAALLAARRGGVRVFTHPLLARGVRDGRVVTATAPSAVSAGEPFEIVAQIASRSEATARLEIRDGERLVEALDLDLLAGSTTVTASIALDSTGNHDLEIRLTTDGDGFATNDVYHIAVAVAAPARVLYLEGRASSADYLRRVLEQAGFRVTTVTGSAVARLEPASVRRFDAVVVSDVPAELLAPRLQTRLEAYVRSGGGLVYAGGETSFGEEGFTESRLEQLLPVRFGTREERKELALIIVLDKSYSMKGVKMELAKEASRAALDLLDERHQFGMVTFDWDPYVTVPLQRVVEPEAIHRRIARVQASAQTNIYPALEQAFEQLVASEAKSKHVILLSDGKSYPNDYAGLVLRMREAEITVSTVGVGDQADRELLGEIAEWGRGRTYAIADARRVKQIFIEETQRAVQETIVEDPVRPKVVHAAEVLAGLDFASAPPLLGFATTQLEEEAELLLATPEDDPLLARWQYGLGRVIAFTSDVKDRWAAQWLGWPGYARFWAQLLRSAQRIRGTAGSELEVTRHGAEARIQLRLVDAEGRFRNGLAPVVTVAGAGEPREVRLVQVAPGEYAGRVALEPNPAAALRFALRGSDAQRSLYYGHLDEYHLADTDHELLRGIARATGGRYAPAPAEPYAELGDRATAEAPLWPSLAMLALLSFLADIFVRRAPWLRRLEGAVEPLPARSRAA